MSRGYDWGGFTPWEHQRAILNRSATREYFALLMDMRTGKTPVIIHNAAYLKSRGEIDGLLVMAPNYLKSEWAEQFITHAPDWLEYDVHIWTPTVKAEKEIRALRGDGRLHVLVMNEEAFSTKRGEEVASAFLYHHKAMFAIDEATSIANPKAKRTRAVLKMRPLAPYRRILTGTPITKGPLDLFSPFYFLDPSILGFKTHHGMKLRHCVLGGFKGKEIMGYVKMDELDKKIAPHSARVLRGDVRDMPPKLYKQIPLDMTPEQGKIYQQMRDWMVAEWEGKRLEAAVVLSQLLRLQQITGGFIPAEGEDTAGPIPGVNPKIEAIMQIVAQTDEKVIIFSRFRPEIAAITKRLREKYGDDSVAEYHGGVGNDDKTRFKHAFKDDPNVRFFVANQRSARMGLDLSVASLVVYMTNSQDLLDRLQTEDRTETIVRDKGSTTYIDLVMKGTFDEKIMESLAAKVSLSNLITKDTRLESWLK